MPDKELLILEWEINESILVDSSNSKDCIRSTSDIASVTLDVCKDPQW